MGLLAACLQAGGHRDTALGQLLAACRDDPAASAMLSARMREDRTVEPALARRSGGAARGRAALSTGPGKFSGPGADGWWTGPASPAAISARTSGRVS